MTRPHAFTEAEKVLPPSLDFTVAEFLKFARSKPADEEYNFCNSSGCAIAQFGQETGRPYLVGVADPQEVLPSPAIKLICVLSLSETWGALVKRLEALS